MRYFFDIDTDELALAAQISKSFDEFKQTLDISYSVGNDLIAFFLLAYDIDFVFNRNTKPKNTKISDERFSHIQSIVSKSFSFYEVGIKLGRASGTKIKQILDNLNIDYSHFTMQNTPVIRLKTYEKILNGEPLTSETLSNVFNKLDITSCQICGRNTWLEQDIPLETHHMNGNHDDNSPKNIIRNMPHMSCSA